MKEKIIQSILQCESMDKILEQCSLFLHNPLVIINETFDIVTYYHQSVVEDEVWNEAVQRGYVTLEFGNVLNRWPNENTKGVYSSITTNSINMKNRRFYKIELNNTFLGYLNILEEYQDLDQCSVADYDFVVSILAKELFTNDHHLQDNSNERFLMKLLKNNFVDFNHFRESLLKTSIHIERSHRVLCMDLQKFISYEAKNDVFKNELLALFPNAITIIEQNVLSILIEENVFQQLQILENESILLFCKKYKIKIGLSDSFDDLFHFSMFQKNAFASIFLSKYLIEEDGIIFYDQVRVYDFISQSSRELLMQCCKKVILDIYAFDKKSGSDFLKTLFIYIATKHSIKTTSKIMFVHRNTITYRIKRMKDLFGIDFLNHFLEFDYYFSCQILQVLENNFIKS